jgi:oligoribonuclease
VLGIFLDTETNGLNPKTHKILEIAYQILHLGTGALLESFQAHVAHSIEAWSESDKESLKINGFQWEEIARGTPAGSIEEAIIASFLRCKIRRKEAVFICQNPSFDRTFFSQLIDPNKQESLQWPYHWLDLASMHWALSLERRKTALSPFPWDIGLSKDNIASYYHLPPEAKPHRAMNGVAHLLLCYEAMIGFPQKKKGA